MPRHSTNAKAASAPSSRVASATPAATPTADKENGALRLCAPTARLTAVQVNARETRAAQEAENQRKRQRALSRKQEEETDLTASRRDNLETIVGILKGVCFY